MPHCLWVLPDSRAQHTTGREKREKFLSSPAGEGFNTSSGDKQKEEGPGEQNFSSCHTEKGQELSPPFRGLPFLVPLCQMEGISGSLDGADYAHTLSLEDLWMTLGEKGTAYDEGSQASVTDSLHFRPTRELDCQVHSLKISLLPYPSSLQHSYLK